MKPSEINSSGKPALLQAGRTKGGGGVTRAQSHLIEAGTPVGLSGWLDCGGGTTTGREGGVTVEGENSSGLFLLPSRLLPLLSTDGTPGESR